MTPLGAYGAHSDATSTLDASIGVFLSIDPGISPGAMCSFFALLFVSPLNIMVKLLRYRIHVNLAV